MQSVIGEVYEETRGLYAAARGKLAQHGADHGFKILYGPVRIEPETLIVGFQPGGDAGHIRRDEMEGPSLVNEYLAEDWPLAAKLRKRFGHNFLEPVLGTNALYFRSPSVEAWQRIGDRSARNWRLIACARLRGS